MLIIIGESLVLCNYETMAAEKALSIVYKQFDWGCIKYSFSAVLSSATLSIFDSYSLLKGVPLCWVPDSELPDFVSSIVSAVLFNWPLVTILLHIQNTAII